MAYRRPMTDNERLARELLEVEHSMKTRLQAILAGEEPLDPLQIVFIEGSGGPEPPVWFTIHGTGVIQIGHAWPHDGTPRSAVDMETVCRLLGTIMEYQGWKQPEPTVSWEPLAPRPERYLELRLIHRDLRSTTQVPLKDEKAAEPIRQIGATLRAAVFVPV
jgi:hypothetical protein